MKCSFAISCRSVALTATLLGLMPPAHAVDGTKLIDMARVASGGLTPGDAPGFPVTISQPGSYRLSSNLVVPDANTTAIQITASHVTLDLNGFAILGSTDCSASLDPCAGAGTGRGIESEEEVNITIRNGTIQGMGLDGIRLRGGSHLVEYMRVSSNGGRGVIITTGGQGGMHIVQYSSAHRNSSNGFFIDIGAIRNNVADGNGFAGIQVDAFGSASHNVVSRSERGLLAGNLVSYFGNSFVQNTTNVAGSPRNLGQNLCSTLVCPGAQF